MLENKLKGLFFRNHFLGGFGQLFMQILDVFQRGKLLGESEFLQILVLGQLFLEQEGQVAVIIGDESTLDLFFFAHHPFLGGATDFQFIFYQIKI